MLLAWRFSRTFASRFNFANVVFFLAAKVDLPVEQANRGPGQARRRRAEHGFAAGGRATSSGKASRVHTARGFGAANRGVASGRGTASKPRTPVAATAVHWSFRHLSPPAGSVPQLWCDRFTRGWPRGRWGSSLNVRGTAPAEPVAPCTARHPARQPAPCSP